MKNITIQKSSRTLIAAACGLVFAGLAHAQNYESVAGLKAADFAPPALLSSSDHQVDADITLVGGFPRYTVRSPHGVWQADGQEMLAVRISELPAFKQMETISKTDAFTKAAGAALADPVKLVGSLVESPAETGSNIVSGIGLIATRIGNLAGQAANRVGDQVSGNMADQKPLLKPQEIGTGLAAPRNVISDPLGYNAKRREWAQKLTVDPYTNNAALSDKLGDFASASFVGSFPVTATLGVVVAPLTYGVEFNEAARLEACLYPPIDIEMRNTERLKKMGVADLAIRNLTRNKHFTPTLQTALLLALEALGNLSGRQIAVEFATRAGSDVEARYAINSVAMLARHAKKAPLAGIIAADNVLTAKTADGKLVVAVPMDFIPWVKQVEDFARRQDLQGSERWLLISGRASPRARDELAKHGWRVVDSTTPGA